MQSWNQWGVGGAPYNYQTAAPVSSTSAVTPDLQNYGSSNYQYYSTAGAPETAQADLTTYNQQQQYTMQQQQQQWQQWTQWQQQFQQWQQQYGDKYQQAVGGLPGVPLPPGAPTAQNGQTTATSYNPSVQPPLPPLPPSEKVVNPPLPVDPPLPSTQPIQPPLPPQPSQPPPGQPPTSQPPNQPPPALQSLPAQPPLQQPPPLMQTNQPPPSSTHQHGMHQQGYPQGQMYPGSNSSYFSGSYDSGGAPDNNQAGYYGHQEDGYAAMHQYSGTSYSSGTGGGQYEGFGSGAGGAGRKRAGAAGDGPYDSAKDIGAKKMRMDMPPQLDKLPEEEGQDGWKHWSGEGGGKGGRIEQMPGSQRGDVNKQGSAGKPKEAAPDDELSEAEKSFDAQFVQWESQFMRWKEQNKNHSDKNQYREYEAKWESWREQLLQRREQMKKKRENGKGPSSNDGSKHAPSPFSKNLPAPSEKSPEGHPGEGPRSTKGGDRWWGPEDHGKEGEDKDGGRMERNYFGEHPPSAEGKLALRSGEGKMTPKGKEGRWGVEEPSSQSSAYSKEEKQKDKAYSGGENKASENPVKEDPLKDKIADIVEPKKLGLLGSGNSDKGIPGLDMVTSSEKEKVRPSGDCFGELQKDSGEEGWQRKDQDDRQDSWLKQDWQGEGKGGSSVDGFLPQRDKGKAPLLPIPSERRDDGKNLWQNPSQSEQSKIYQHDKPPHGNRPVDAEEGKKLWQNQQQQGPHSMFGSRESLSLAHGQVDNDMRTEDGKQWKGEGRGLPDMFVPPPELQQMPGRHLDSDLREDDKKQWQQHGQPEGFAFHGGMSVGGRPMDGRPMDVRPMDGRPMDGRPMDGRPMDGRPMDGRPMDGRPMDGRPMDGRPMDNRPMVGRPMDGRPMDGRPMDNMPMVGRPMDGRPMDGRPMDNRPMDGRPMDGRPMDGRPMDGRPMDNRPMDGRPMDGRPMDNRPMDNRPMDNRPMDNRPMDNRPMDNRPMDNRPMDNRPMDNRPMDNRPMDNRPMDNRPMENRPMDNRPMDNRPMNNRPMDNRPMDNRPMDNRPMDNRPMDNRPMDNRPMDNRPMDNRPMDSRPMDSDMRTDNSRPWQNQPRGPRDQFESPEMCPPGGRQLDSDMRNDPNGPWQNHQRGPMDMFGSSDVRQGNLRDNDIDIRNDLNKPWQGRGPPDLFAAGMRPSGNDGSQQQNFKPLAQGMSKPPPFMDNSRFPHDEMRHQMQSDPKHQCDDYGHEEPRDPYPRGRGGWPNEEEFCRPQWRDEPPRNKRFDGPPREEWDDYRGMNRPLMEPPFEHRPYFEGDERGGNMGAEEARLRDLSSRPYEMDEERYMRGGPEGWEMREAHHPDPLLGPPIWDERPRASPPPAERQWAPEFVAPTVVDYGHMPRQEPPPPRPPSPPRNFTGNVQTFDYCHGVSRNPLPFAVDSVQREQWRGDEYGDREPRIVREAPRTWEHDDHSPSRGRNSSGRENQRRESRWEKPRWSNSKHGETEPSRWEEEESRYSAGSDRWGGNQSRKERERDRDRDRDRSRKSRQRGEGEERSGSSGGGNASRGNTHDSEKDRERSSRHKKEDSGSSSRNTGSGGGNGGSSGSHPLVSYPLPASSSPPPPPTISQQVQPSLAKLDTILIEDLLLPPGRATRPPRIVIILRGPPGSGKTFVAKLVKDKEVEQGGSAPRILSLDDYFMVEFEKEEKDAETGRKVTNKLMKYEYEAEMEKQYRNSLVKAFRKTVDDGYFPFIIVDCVNDKVRQFDEMWTYAKQKGFQVYICEMDMDVSMCSKRNTHGRNLRDIEEMVKHWEETPRSYVRVDVRSLLQSAAITEVEMEDTTEEKAKEESKTPEKDGELEKGGAEEDAEKIVTSSKWEGMEASEEKLDRLDGLAKKRRSENPPQSLEDWLQLTDDYEKRKCTPGKKQVRWADLEERRQQERIRAIGFVVGQTDWSRMTDPTFGQGALTQTKYI